MADFQSIGPPSFEGLKLMDEIERRNAECRRDLMRVLSAAVWTPEPRRGVWGRLLAWIGRRT